MILSNGVPSRSGGVRSSKRRKFSDFFFPGKNGNEGIHVITWELPKFPGN